MPSSAPWEAANRLDYSLLGRAVHVAGRLADEALAGDVLLSHEAYAKVQDCASAEALSPLKLQGIDEAIPVYSLATGTIRQQQIASARTASGTSSSSTTLVEGVSEKAALTLSSLDPGTVLGKRYEIRRVLGSGGMGMVFQAHDRDLDEPVALKILRPEDRLRWIRRFWSGSRRRSESRAASPIETWFAPTISATPTGSSSSAWSSSRA